MPFEPLSYRRTFSIDNFPERWLPLIHLYDPDLPLFPTCYFHVLPDNFPSEIAPDFEDRAYGFIDRIRPIDSVFEISIICNKDLGKEENLSLRKSVELEVRERLGVSSPVIFSDISTAFRAPLDGLNRFLVELWNRMVPKSLGYSIPFGRFYDEVFGLVRMVSTFNPPAGRKSELIQTHYFLSKFGMRIKSAVEAPKANFYLLPTYHELISSKTSPKLFPKFKALCDAVDNFCAKFSDIIDIDGLSFSRFKRPAGKQLDTENLLDWIHSLRPESREPLVQCFNAFDKGPPRTTLFILMLKDLKDRRLLPKKMTPAHFGLIYHALEGSRQSPKVLNLYAQQCFGNSSAFPTDTWIKTFMEWPLRIYPFEKEVLLNMFRCSLNLGKVERLLWLAAQSRKVHSPLCDDALWCTKFDSTAKPRGANPLSCCACSVKIRDSCPGFANIAEKKVSFNANVGANFDLETSGRNNTTLNQRFSLCKGKVEGKEIHDDFTSVDIPEIFHAFPQHPHQGQVLSVKEFIGIYRKPAVLEAVN